MTAHYLERQGPYRSFSNTEVRYYPLGEDMFADMIPALESAQQLYFH